jgi:hypothetical protein
MEELARLSACTQKQAIAILREHAERYQPAKAQADLRIRTALAG